MNIGNRVPPESKKDRHWITCNPSDADPEKQKLDVFSKKLENTLNDLGRIDYQLQNALLQLSNGKPLNSYDALDVQITRIVSPGIQHALAALAEEISRAKEIADELSACGRDS